MAEKTKISWADSTGSPWFGCTEVSPGCANCYAREMTLRNKWAGWGDGAPRVRSKGFWGMARELNREAEPMVRRSLPGGSRRPRMFPSLMDWLDPKAPIELLAEFLKLIRDTPNLDWLLLTKRPELFQQRLKDSCWYENGTRASGKIQNWLDGEPPSNVWVGVTCEDQARAYERIPELLKIPAKVRFLSCEPLLERMDISNKGIRNGYSVPTVTDANGYGGEWTDPGDAFIGVNWVIIGGESGRNRREAKGGTVEAITDIVRQCQSAGVPCWVKQDCALKPGKQGRIPNDIWNVKQLPETS